MQRAYGFGVRVARMLPAAVLGHVIGTFPTADRVARRAPGGTVDLRDVGAILWLRKPVAA
jgi:hypothetical protein